MRDIKFRAWDKEDERMIINEQDFIPLKVTNKGVLRLNPHHKENLWNFVDSDRVILMESTGLKDKCGKEIYEGDICKYVILAGQEKVNPLQALLVVIEWKNASWGYRHLFPDLVVEEDREWSSFWRSDEEEMWSNEYFEVIGNIYENKELLK